MDSTGSSMDEIVLHSVSTKSAADNARSSLHRVNEENANTNTNINTNAEVSADIATNTIRLLTLNCWGLKHVSKLREQRLRAIACELANTDHDVVALQEVWVEDDWRYIEEKCRATFPYMRVFSAGILAGPGLAILSKVPIEKTFLYRFPINGRPSAFFRGDWFVGKSVAVTILKPLARNGRQIAVLNSHMHAPYKTHGDASYSTHRACQAWDLAHVAATLRSAGYAVVQVGDLNSRPGSLPYRIFTAAGGLVDSWSLLHGAHELSADAIALLPPHDQIRLGGVTCDSQLNTWRATREPWEACRLDYALVDGKTLEPVEASVQFTELLPHPLNCSYSDHFAYSVTLRIHDRPHLPPVASSADLHKLYNDTLAELDVYLGNTIPFQHSWRSIHVYASIVAIVVIHISISFAAAAQPWAAVLLSLASTLIAVAAVLNALICFFGVRSEKRALHEVRSEVTDALRGLERDGRN